MARIDALPSLEIIRGLKGILDFYVWRGLPCVRAWPKYRPARQTDASLAAALTFGAIVKAYSLLANLALEAYREDALDQPRTARDIMVTGAYGNLHEASMSDFLDALIIIRDATVALTDLLNALHSVDTDEIIVRVEHSMLPDGAATAAAQATQLTALQKIDDLQDALQSKALDRFLVRGMNQLFSYVSPLIIYIPAVISGAGGFIQSSPVPAGTIWHLFNVLPYDLTSPTTEHQYVQRIGAADYEFGRQTAAFPAGRPSIWQGFLSLDPGHILRTYFIGGLAGDNCILRATGYIMTKEI